jgi:hypothetical protein
MWLVAKSGLHVQLPAYHFQFSRRLINYLSVWPLNKTSFHLSVERVRARGALRMSLLKEDDHL